MSSPSAVPAMGRPSLASRRAERVGQHHVPAWRPVAGSSPQRRCPRRADQQGTALVASHRQASSLLDPHTRRPWQARLRIPTPVVDLRLARRDDPSTPQRVWTSALLLSTWPPSFSRYTECRIVDGPIPWNTTTYVVARSPFSTSKRALRSWRFGGGSTAADFSTFGTPHSLLLGTGIRCGLPQHVRELAPR
jgi:hypothetical protein